MQINAHAVTVWNSPSPIAVPISDYISFRHELSTAGTVCLKRPSSVDAPSVNAFKRHRILASEEDWFLYGHLVRITLIGCCWLLMSQSDVRWWYCFNYSMRYCTFFRWINRKFQRYCIHYETITNESMSLLQMKLPCTSRPETRVKKQKTMRSDAVISRTKIIITLFTCPVLYWNMDL